MAGILLEDYDPLQAQGGLLADRAEMEALDAAMRPQAPNAGLLEAMARQAAPYAQRPEILPRNQGPLGPQAPNAAEMDERMSLAAYSNEGGMPNVPGALLPGSVDEDLGQARAMAFDEQANATRSPLLQAGEQFNTVARGLLGPGYQSAQNVAEILPGAADVRDLGRGLAQAGRGAVGLDWRETVGGIGQAGQAAAGMTPTGKAGVLTGKMLGAMIGGTAAARYPGAMEKAFNKAEKMGVDPDVIWIQTGLMRGADGQMRFEIPDQDASFTPNADGLIRRMMRGDVPGGQNKLSRFIDHPELYANYPGLKDVKVKLKQGRGGGSFNPSRNEITLEVPRISQYRHPSGEPDAMDVTKVRSVMFHEIQHAVQQLEGFAQGGNPDWIKYLARLDPAFAKLPKDKQEDAAYEAYRRLAGEVESRVVQKRAGVGRTADFNETQIPTFDEDVARSDQTVMGARGAPPGPLAADVRPPAGGQGLLAPGQLPIARGAAPDRSGHTILRHIPAQGVRPRTVRALKALDEDRNGVRTKIMEDIQEGLKVGGADWYNTEPLRDYFIQKLGKERGHNEWRDFMELMGATSTGNKVPSNMRVASYYRSMGPEWVRENAKRLGITGGIVPDVTGYGHKMQKNHAANVRSLYTGDWDARAGGVDPRQNPKPRGFAGSLLGNARNIAADLHFTRYMGMADNHPDWLENGADISAEQIARLREKYGTKVNRFIKTKVDKDSGKTTFTIDAKNMVAGKPRTVTKSGKNKGKVTPGIKKLGTMEDFQDVPTVWTGMPADNEYKAFEDYIAKLGESLGLTAAQTQAALWMGGAQRTGLAEESKGTFMELFNKRVAARAAETGKTPQQVLDEFITTDPTTGRPGLLEIGGAAGGAGLAAGGLLGQEEDPMPGAGA